MREGASGSSPPSSGSTGSGSSPDVITVALIEDNRLVLEAITSLLQDLPDVRVVSGDPSSLQTLSSGVTPQVVLLDLGLEDEDSLEVAKRVMARFPNAGVLVMDLLPAQEEISDFVSAGVAGFIMKDATLDTVARSIRKVAAGQKVLPPQMTSALFSEIAREAVSNGHTEDEAVRLTPREREVIHLIAEEGLTNKAIAKRLDISVHTVKSHLRNVMEKLTLHSRLELAAYWHSRGDDEDDA